MNKPIKVLFMCVIILFVFAFSIVNTYKVYIPMVLNGHLTPFPTSAPFFTPSPTPSLTPAPTITPVNLIKNPSFDEGTENWKLYGGECEMMVVTDVFDHENNVLMIRCIGGEDG